MFITALVIQIFAVVLTFALLCYTICQKPSEASRNVLIILICTGIAMLGYLFEFQATNLEEAKLAVRIGYLGKPFLLLETFYFVARYSKIKLPKWLFWSLLSLCVFFIAIIYTNDYHHLYYASTDFVEGFGGHYWTKSKKGPLYIAYVVMTAGYFIANIVFAVISTKKAKNARERNEALFIYALIVIGVLGYVVYLTGITQNYDTTVLGLFFDAIILVILFWKYSILDTLTLAKDKALDNYSNALIILDTANTIIYINKTAKKLFPNIKEGIRYALEGSENLKPGDLYYHDELIYRYSAKPIEHAGSVYGTIIEFRDVTRDVNYNKHLNYEVEERTKEIKSIQREVIFGFANIVEARNRETGDHIKKTAGYVKDIAEALSKKEKYKNILTKKEIEMFWEVAPLHDVGKIVISDIILLKPGRFNKEEYDIMKTHTTFGAKLIDENLTGVETEEYVRLAHNVALYHHEWWDGSGYPNGIKGEAIPLEARIMAVADVYDALRSERPYKAMMSKEESLAIMKSERGTHFDPEILDIFIELISKE